MLGNNYKRFVLQTSTFVLVFTFRKCEVANRYDRSLRTFLGRRPPVTSVFHYLTAGDLSMAVFSISASFPRSVVLVVSLSAIAAPLWW
jgi:hypothetical protein